MDLSRRLILFLSVTFGKTFLGTIKPKRGMFWLVFTTVLIFKAGVKYDLLRWKRLKSCSFLRNTNFILTKR